MTKAEIKHKAQDELLSAMQVAFNTLAVDSDLWVEADKQMERVEKLFGYVPGSWNRGV